MRGGMFLDYQGPIEAVSTLLETTKVRLRRQIAFAGAVRQLDAMIAEIAEPLNLAPLYCRVPEPMRGLVELTYDLQNRPSWRFIEPFLYASDLYDETLQEIRLSLPPVAGRAFVLSSPRFDDGASLRLPVPFRSGVIDDLSRARWHPLPLDELRDLVGYAALGDVERAVFDRMIVPAADRRPPAPAFSGPGVRVRYFGHATVLIETAESAILIDPAIAYPGSTDDDACLTLADLPERIDKVLLTHNHQDHVMLETLLQLRYRIGQIVVPRSAGGALQDPSLKLMLGAIGFADVVELDEMEHLPLSDGGITGIPFFGEHADLAIRSKLAYAVALVGRQLLFLADSNALEPAIYDYVGRHIGPVDLLFVGLECDGAPLSWLYGPLFTRPLSRAVDQSRRLNSSDCAGVLAIVERLQPAAVCIYAMGLESWLGYISSIEYTDESAPIVESNALLAACRARGIPAERLYMKRDWLLEPGFAGRVPPAPMPDPLRSRPRIAASA